MAEKSSQERRLEPFELLAQTADKTLPNPAHHPSNQRWPSRRKLSEKIRDAVFDAYGIDDYDPAVQLSLIAMDPAVPIDIRAAAHAKIMPYVHSAMPQIKVEMAPEQAVQQQNDMVAGLLKIIDVIPGAVAVKPTDENK